ncbi:MAG: hypothetical protein AAB883_03315, partial [Patescibacteria group bacterium]
TFTAVTAPTGQGAASSGTTIKSEDVNVVNGQSVNVNVKGGASGTADMCAACDSVPEAYRAQCKAAAGCKP